MTCTNLPSGVGCDSDSLDVGNDINSGTEQIKVEDFVSNVGWDSDSLDIGNDFGSCIEHVKVEDAIDLGD